MKSVKITTTLKELKALTTTFTSHLNTTMRTIRDTYDSDIETVKEDLLSRIAIEYSLDLSELKSKFLRKKKKQNLDNDNDDANNSDSEYMPSINQSTDKQILLIKHTYDNNNYYIEMIDGGKVYDANKNEVGIWTNGQMELNMSLISQLKIIDSHINEHLLRECASAQKADEHLLRRCASAQRADEHLQKANEGSVSSSNRLESISFQDEPNKDPITLNSSIVDVETVSLKKVNKEDDFCKIAKKPQPAVKNIPIHLQNGQPAVLNLAKPSLVSVSPPPASIISTKIVPGSKIVPAVSVTTVGPVATIVQETPEEINKKKTVKRRVTKKFLT